MGGVSRSRRGKLCSVGKANVMETGALWREEVEKMHAAEFSNVALSHMHVDNAAMQVVYAPAQFDVMVTDNIFGDILSDAAAVAAGWLGMLPFASLGPVDKAGRLKAIYEPVHGSAPDIAGKSIANPLGSILSVAMMLRLTLGRPSDAAMLEHAVQQALAGGARTGDIAEPGSPLVHDADERRGDGRAAEGRLTVAQSGSKAMEAMMGGSVDAVAGAYSNGILMAARGQKVATLVNFLRCPGYVLAVGKAHDANQVSDLRGMMIGVTAPGSSTQQALNLFVKAGLTIGDHTAIGIGLGRRGALREGRLDIGRIVPLTKARVRKASASGGRRLPSCLKRRPALAPSRPQLRSDVDRPLRKIGRHPCSTTARSRRTGVWPAWPCRPAVSTTRTTCPS